MNKHLHRIIFNAKRGQRMAVSEIASSCGGKGASGDTASPLHKSVAAGVAATVATAALAAGALAMIALFTTADAQIVADPNAPRNQQPTVLTTANGLPLVNIQTPSAAGVSRNTYTQFDVNRPGAVLNNSRTNVQTQTGGWAQGNPWLATGAARVILNEVNSSTPSQLRGFVEVAGSRAEVIIANPSGVNIDGGGFINAGRATITTGTPVMNGGNLEGFVVQKGLITISGAGLDSSQTDFTGLIARAVEVNAGIWANELKVTTGANQVSADQTSSTPVAGNGAAPAFALDVSQLGGMYAGKITLVGTEAGVGVRNAGKLGASAGDVVLQTNGWLTNSGSIQATGNTSVTAQGSITHTGTLSAQGNTTVQAVGAGSSISAAAGSVLAAGLNPDGSFSSTGALSVNGAGAVALNGQTLVGGDMTLSGSQINLASSQLSAQNLSITASAGGIDASRANVTAQGSLSASAAQGLRTDAAFVQANQLNLTAQDLSNVAGEIIQTGTGDASIALTSPTGTIDNSQGRIATNAQNLTLSAQTLTNQGGKIEHAGTGTLGITVSALNGQGGQITSDGALSLQAGSVNHDSATTVARQISISASDVSNRSGAITQTGSDAASIIATGAINNTGGSIASNGDTRISAQSLNNQGGVIQATGAANLSLTTSAALDNSAGGQIAAGGNALVAAGSINNNQGRVTAGADLGISASQAVNNSAGFIAANGAVTVTAVSLNNEGGQVQAVGGLNLTVGEVINTQGLLRSGANLALATTTLGNNNTQASNQGIEGQSVSITAASVSNAQGSMVAGTNLALTSTSLTGAGTLISQGDLSLAVNGNYTHTGELNASGTANVTVGGALSNQGKLLAGNTLNVLASDIDNAAGAEMTATNTNVTATNTLTNRGLIDGEQTRIRATTVNNLGTGRIFGTDLAIAATTLTNDAENGQAPVIAARNRLDIGAQTINNRNDALIFSGGDMAIGGSLDANWRATGRAQVVNNNSATIEALGSLSITTAQLNNTNDQFTYAVTPGGTASKADYFTTQGVLTDAQVSWVGFLAYAIPYTSPYANPRYKTYFEGPPAFQEAYSIGGGGSDVDGNVTYFPRVFNYSWDSPIWADLGMTPPTGPIPPLGGYMDYSLAPPVFVPPTAQEILAHDAAVQKWIDLQARLTAFTNHVYTNEPHFTVYRNYTETSFTATTLTSKPGQILSGGTMTLAASDALVNDKSRIIAGGALNVTGTAIDNRAMTITANNQRSGTTYSFGVVGQDCSFLFGCDDVYGWRTSAYEQEIPQTITLALSQSQGSTAPPRVGDALAPVAVAGPGQSVGSITQVAALNTAPGAQAIVIRTTIPNTVLPSNSLFRINPAPTSSFLVETDPRFTNYRTWLSSDFMLSALGLNPTVSQKRLGDGFYEQRLINEQVAQLTGLRFLQNFASDEAQYRSLMTNGATFAQQHTLRPGIALSAAQMAQLTSDIVWLVEREVTLADGTKQKVLVPQVYVAVQPGDIKTDGSLMAGQSINLNLTGNATNSGTIAGRNIVSLTANNIHNNLGRIQGQSVNLAAQTDLTNTGGVIQAKDSLSLAAGRDLTVASTSGTAGAGNNQYTGIDRVAGLYVTNPGGTLVASAGRDINLVAAQLINDAPTGAGQSGQAGTTMLSAGRDINLGVISQGEQSEVTWDERNYARMSQSRDAGTSITGKGAIALQAGNNITAIAADINSTQGAVTAQAGGDVRLLAGTSSYSTASASYAEGSGFLTSGSTETRQSNAFTRAIGTSLAGTTTGIAAGGDISIKGSRVISDQQTTLRAGNNIEVLAVDNTSSQSSFRETKGTGLSMADAGITYGSQKDSLDQKSKGTTAAASTVGSINGNVTIQAGQSYRQVGSDVLAPSGDITIVAKKIDIIEARETTESTTEQKSEQSGLTLAVSGSAISTFQSIEKMIDAAEDTKSSKMKGLAAASAALSIMRLGKGSSGSGTSASQSTAATGAPSAGAEGQGASAAADTGSATSGANGANGANGSSGANGGPASPGIDVSLSYGTSQSQSMSKSQSDTARGSTLVAGNNITLLATGGGKDSNITIQGSTLQAGNAAQLIADNQIRLLAARNTASQASTNSSSSSSAGISYGSNGLMFNVSAAEGKGKADGQDLSYTNTEINAGNKAGTNPGSKVTLISGGDTTLQGAVVKANQVQADVGGNLSIASLQDSSTYSSKQNNISASVSVGWGNNSASASVSASKINSDFLSVGQQSGIKAGDGGFQVNVQGNTELKGAVIASTDKAVNEARNTFTTGGELTLSDLQNKAEYKANSFSVSVGTSGSTPSLTGAGIGLDKGNASSTSSSGISGIAGNTAVRSTDAETGIKRIFEAVTVQKEINAQTAITAAFGSQASAAWGEYANKKFMDAVKAGKEDDAKCWAPDGTCRAGGHALIGGLTGGAAGATSAAASSVAAPHMQAFLISTGVTPAAASAITQLSAFGAGSALGGAAGRAAAFNETGNNAVIAIPLIVEGVIAGGALAARACLSSPACLRALQLGGTALVAKVAAVLTPDQLSQIPGFGAGLPLPPTASGGTPATAPTGPKHTGGNQLDHPTGVTTTGGSQTIDPNLGNSTGGGYGAGTLPVFDPLTMSVPPVLLGSDGKLLPGINGSGTPIPMPPTANPNQAAEDFAKQAFNGQIPTRVKTDVVGVGSWLATLPDGTTVLYRPAGQRTRTDSDTANVDINSADIRGINRNEPAKFKFPKK